MATDLGSADGVRRILGKNSQDITTNEAEAFLNEAIRKLKSKYYTNYMEDKVYANTIIDTGAVNRVYGTYFTMKDSDSDVAVYVNGVALTQTTQYTIDASASEITILDDVTLNDGDIINIYYIPIFFDDYVNYMAAQKLMMTSLVDIPLSAQATSINTSIKEEIQEFHQMVMSKPEMVRVRDHRETGSIF